jgi:hypothetical protein
MEIRFVSSLTPDDEERLASPLLQLVCAVLDELPIAYTLVIETTTGTCVQHSHSDFVSADSADDG